MKDLNKLSVEQIDYLIALKKKQLREAKKASEVKPSQLETLGRGALDAATLGFAPKIKAGIGTTIARTLRPELFEEETFKETYENARNNERLKDIQAAEENPKTNIAANLVGGLALPFPAKTVGQAAKLGAGYGAGYGLASQDFNTGKLGAEDVISAGLGGLTGGLLGAGLQKGVNMAFNKKAPLPNVTEEGLNLSNQFDVPLTYAELTNNPKDFLTEEVLRQKGDFNLNNLQQQQRQKYDEALKKLNPSQPLTKGEGFTDIASNIVNNADKERKAYQELYTRAKEGVAKVKTEDIKEFPKLIKQDFAENVLSQDNVPKTFRELQGLENILQDTNVDLKRLEAWKQGLNRSIRETEKGGQEEFALKQLSNKFDGFLDGVIEKALTEGDANTLNDFKKARSLASDYFQKYQAKNPTEYGKRFLEDIIDNARFSREPLTNEQLANKIFGASDLGFDKNSAGVVKELKKQISKEDFDLLKAEALRKLTTPLEKNQPNVLTYKNNLNKLLTNNKSLADELFSPKELETLQKFGKISEKIFTRQKGNVNPSGSAALFDALNKNRYFSWLKNFNYPTNEKSILKKANKQQQLNIQKPSLIKGSERALEQSIIGKLIKEKPKTLDDLNNE